MVHYVLTYFHSIDVHELNPKLNLTQEYKEVTTMTPSAFFSNYTTGCIATS